MTLDKVAAIILALAALTILAWAAIDSQKNCAAAGIACDHTRP